MDVMNSPRMARGLLRAALPPDRRDAVLGDLEEGFAQAAAPRWWYWKQVLRSMGPAIRLRWRSPGVMRIVVAILASYVVLAACVVGLEAAISPFVREPNMPYMLLSLLVGAIGAFTSGIVAALMVPMLPMRAVKVFFAFLCVMAAVSFAMDGGRTPLWYQLVLLVAGPTAAYVGGRMTAARRTQLSA